MKAIRVIIDKKDTLKMVECVPVLNRDAKVAAMIARSDMFCVATADEITLELVKAALTIQFGEDYTIENIK
jgi:2-C-methyl-D-erythritol 4-phosphate cytidylyltransferase